MATYKCCWNCGNGFTCATSPKEKEIELNASKRFCCANYPVSNHLENPFKQRYCKQFHPPMFGIRFGHEITKAEAEKLMKMTPAELVEYWKKPVTNK